jgi:hypothetical protein
MCGGFVRAGLWAAGAKRGSGDGEEGAAYLLAGDLGREATVPTREDVAPAEPHRAACGDVQERSHGFTGEGTEAGARGRQHEPRARARGTRRGEESDWNAHFSGSARARLKTTAPLSPVRTNESIWMCVTRHQQGEGKKEAERSEGLK